MKTQRNSNGCFPRTTRLALAALAVLSLSGIVLARPATAAPVGRVVLAGHIAPEAVKSLTLAGRLTPAKILSLDLVLPLRNQAGLQDLLRRQADPADALYGKYLTPTQFADRFGPDMADVSAVAAFARAQGLRIEEISANRTTLHVTGPVNAVETAFGVRMQSYAGKHGEAFYAPDAEPTIPSALAGKLMAVVGLHHLGTPHAFSRRVQPRPSSPTALPNDARPLSFLNASGNAGLSPTDIRTIYNLTGVSSRGTGQTLGLYELDTYTPSDIAAYESYYALPNVPLQNVGVNGFNTSTAPGGAAAEVTLDIEMFLALAPSASKIIVYEGDGNADFETVSLDIFNKIASDNLASVTSVSYGLSEINVTQAAAQSINQAFQQFQSQGQTVCIASGDAGAYTDQSNWPNDLPNTSEPGSQPLATSVGGTDVFDSNNAPYTYVSETSWADPLDSGRGFDGTGGGGGISEYWTLPSYQQGAFSTSVNPQGSTTMRNVPDVALYGDYDDGTGYDVYFQGGWGGYNGTSASSPLWAAFLADVNQARLAAGRAKLGLANTAIYAVAKSSKYASDFHDINDNSNNLYYNAVAGYDNSTGWGSFNGVNLFNDLVSYGTVAPPAITSFTPTSGPVGTDVFITGTNLSGTTGVKFNGVSSTTYAVDSSTLVEAIVPTGATTGKITVTTSAGTATSSGTYTVTTTSGPPTITGFTPTSGPVGTTVVLTGTNFTGATAVGFTGAHATFTVNSATQITATVPSGAQTGTLAVATPSGTAKSAASFTVTTVSAPTITSFSPTSGPVGTSVTITGTNFTGASSVKFHGTAAATFQVASATSITATVPSGATTGTITVTTAGGTATSSGTYTVTTTSGPPTITSFSPTSGPVGTSVVITGTNFTGATVVGFTGAHATFTVNSATQITATVPSGAQTGTLAVATPSGTAKSAASFTVTTGGSGPTITSFTPPSGPIGTVVVITGTNFASTTGVKFHGTAASGSINSNTQLTVTIPAGATTGTITVTTAGGTATSSASFTVTTSGATISSFTPASGQVGSLVVISGSGFTGATSVKFNGTTAAFTVYSATQITATVPVAATSGPVSVSTPAGSAMSAQSYTVTF